MANEQTQRITVTLTAGPYDSEAALAIARFLLEWGRRHPEAVAAYQARKVGRGSNV